MSVANPLTKAIEIIGNPSKIAKKINEFYGVQAISRMTIYHWDYIPPDWAVDIEYISLGVINAREILDYAHNEKVKSKKSKLLIVN